MSALVVLLFAGFFIGSLVQIAAVLGRKKRGERLDRHRLVFFFLACLMLVCLVPLWIFQMLEPAVWVSNLAVVAANLAGFALTYELGLKEAAPEEPQRKGVRTYMVYYHGSPYGLVTRESFELLVRYELLKKQRTVELVDDFQQRARRQGVQILILQKPDGSQKLIRVEAPT